MAPFLSPQANIVDLSLPLRNFSTELGHFVPDIRYLSADEVARRMARTYQLDLEDLPTPDHLTTELVSLSVHSGTHVDSPYHYGPAVDGSHGRTIDEVPLDWCIGAGIVLDFTAKGAGEIIQEAEVKSALRSIGQELTGGEIVLLRTGWDKRYDKHDFASGHPGLHRDACSWILDQGVRTIGIDTNSLDAPTPIMVERLRAGDREQFYQCHYLGREREFLMVEKLANLDQLPSSGFTFMAFPVSVAGCSGGWARAVAVVEGGNVGS